MVDKKITEAIHAKIDELEEYARKQIESNPTVRDIHYDMVDAVEICRGVMCRIEETEDDRAYLVEAIKALKDARANYRFSAVDEGGYGIVTFHQVIKVAEDLHESLGGQEEEIAVPAADYLETQILYMPRDPWEQCFRTFAMQDYVGCAVEAERIVLDKTAPVTREVLLLWLISLQRTFRADSAEKAAEMMLPGNYNEPFLCALIGLTMDTKTVEEVAALAGTDEELCQFNFYHGEKLLTAGRQSEAFEALRACADTEADCDERYLALAELKHESRAAIVSIYQLILRARRREEDGDREQVTALYDQAFQLAREHIGDADPVTESIGLRRAFF